MTLAFILDLSDGDPERGLAIEYHATAEDARLHNSYGELSPDEVTRAEWADQYAPYTPPAKAWLDAGYTHGCAGCERQCGYDAERADGSQMRPWFRRGDVFCSQRCMRRAVAERKARESKFAEARAVLAERVPHATVNYLSIGTLGQCDGKHGFDVYARLKFDGGSADWCHACRLAFVLPCDEEAFRKAMRSRYT